MRARVPFFVAATIVALFCFTVIIVPGAAAYKCKPVGTPLEELKQADAVFVGKVRQVKEEESVRVAEFEVEKYWKGATSKTITVSSGKHLYGYRFTKGQK